MTCSKAQGTFPTARARVGSQVNLCRIYGGHCGILAGFLRAVRYPLPVLILPAAIHSLNLSVSIPAAYIKNQLIYMECSLCRLIRRPEHLISRHRGISSQTEGHSFGDHLISESVSVTPSSVIEASIVLCCVFMTRVSRCPISLRSETR
jgi:hypothetical protein